VSTTSYSLLWLIAWTLLFTGDTAFALYDKRGPVKLLGDDNFRSEVIKGASGESAWLVQFFAPWCGHCKALAPKYKAVAKELKGQISVAAVNCDESNSVCTEFGVEGFPTVNFFKGGSPTHYNGAREKEALLEFVRKESGVDTRNDGSGSASDLSSVMTLSFKKVWQFLHLDPKPSVIFFGGGSLKETPKWLNTIAMNYKESVEDMKKRGGKHRKTSVAFGYVPAPDGDNPSEEQMSIAKRFKLRNPDDLPAILLLNPEDKTGSGKYIVYDGDLDVRPLAKLRLQIEEFVNLIVNNWVPKDDEYTQNLKALPIPQFPQPPIPSKKTPPLGLTRLNGDNLEDECFFSKGKMCMIALLPEKLSDQSINALLQSVARKYKTDPVALGYVEDASSQDDFLEAFGDSDFDATSLSLVAIKSGRRPRFAFGSALNTEEALVSFIDSVLSGTTTFTRFKGGLPTLKSDWEKEL